MAFVESGCAFGRVEAQICFAFIGVKSVARETGIGKERANVAIEENWRIGISESNSSAQHRRRGPKAP